MKTIQFDREICSDVAGASRREWLQTNGIGGFASSTIIGLNTRRYHGLLTAALHPPVGRMVLLSKLEEVVIADGVRFELSANRYPGVIHPEGYLYLKNFKLDPFPVFTYELGELTVEKTVFMVQGENTTAVSYRLLSPGAPCELRLRPLIAFRDYHSTAHENGAIRREFQNEDGLVTLAPYEGVPPLYLAHNAAAVEGAGDWYRNFEYQLEQERGLDFHEDLFNPLELRFHLDCDTEAVVIASMESRSVQEFPALRETELERRHRITVPFEDDAINQALAVAADQFIVARGDQKTVIAGYHWFCDWGRDTMVSLPGIIAIPGRAEEARGILRTFIMQANQGIIPNRFPDSGEIPEYNTVDATLWLFHALGALAEATGDYAFIRAELYEALTDIVDWHVRGTHHGIHVDEDGLLAAGVPGVQLTWMDVKIGDWVVTPRHGKPVEIQALWYNALRVMEHLASKLGDDPRAARYSQMASQARDSFNAAFWDAASGRLFDVIDGGNRDGSIRPNQIFAVSLPHTMLSPDKARSVVAVVEKHLLTPYGLRTLAPSDPHYRGRYEGDPASRDSAYHQGTVWPWLMGPFITAFVKVNGGGKAVRRRAAGLLAPLNAYLTDAGVGQIPEIFDGDYPHQSRGCIAQAWSILEILRARRELGQMD